MSFQINFSYSIPGAPSRQAIGSPRFSTNPGWPDPNVWIRDLVEELQGRAEVYAQETDVELRRNKAAAMLARVLLSLNSLPPVAESAAHMPLKDLLIFLQDLELGRRHPWSEPVNFGGQHVVPMAKRELRAWAVAVVHVVWMSGYFKKEAYQHVAEIMTASGRTDKDGGPVAWRSVQSWYRKVEAPLETIVGQKLSRWWQVAPCPHGQLVTNCSHGPWDYAMCPQSKEIALELARIIFERPNLRDRFHSPL